MLRIVLFAYLIFFFFACQNETTPTDSPQKEITETPPTATFVANPKPIKKQEVTKPSGFFGSHKFQIQAPDETTTEIKHTIAMRTNLWGSIQWLLAIRSLHDALLEDCFDKIENQFSQQQKKTNWSLWVRILRLALK